MIVRNLVHSFQEVGEYLDQLLPLVLQKLPVDFLEVEDSEVDKINRLEVHVLSLLGGIIVVDVFDLILESVG